MEPAIELIEDAGRAAALLSPVRLQVLAELAEPDSAAGLARRLGLPRQQLNYHVRQLEQDGLVELAWERRRRGCTERVMRAVPRACVISPVVLGPLAADPDRIADRASSGYLLAAAARLIRELGRLRLGADRAKRRVPTLTLDAEVRFASAAAQHAFAEELSESVARLIRKYHDAEAPEGRRFRLLAGAWPVPRENAPGNPEDEEVA